MASATILCKNSCIRALGCTTEGNYKRAATAGTQRGHCARVWIWRSSSSPQGCILGPCAHPTCNTRLINVQPSPHAPHVYTTNHPLPCGLHRFKRSISTLKPVIGAQANAASLEAPRLLPELMERLQLLGYYAAHQPALLLRLTRAARFTAEYHQAALARAASQQAVDLAKEQLAQVCAPVRRCCVLRCSLKEYAVL